MGIRAGMAGSRGYTAGYEALEAILQGHSPLCPGAVEAGLIAVLPLYEP